MNSAALVKLFLYALWLGIATESIVSYVFVLCCFCTSHTSFLFLLALGLPGPHCAFDAHSARPDSESALALQTQVLEG